MNMEPSALGYLHRDTFFHRADPRVKMALVFMGGAVIMATGAPALGVTGVLILAAALWSRLPLRAMIREMRFLAVLALGVALVRAFAQPGRAVFSVHGFSMTLEGLESGGVMALRLVLAALMGAVFSGVTPSSHIRAAIQWFLAPIPFVPEKKAGLMVGLLVRFVPKVFSLGQTVAAAQKSRCIDARNAPVFRLKTFVLAMIVRTFQTADQLVLAMEARCYSEDRTPPEFRLCLADPILLAAAGSLTVFALWP